MPVILVGEKYWRQAFDVDFLVGEGAISPKDQQLFCYAESAAEIWKEICNWHRASGKPLLCEAQETDKRAT